MHPAAHAHVLSLPSSGHTCKHTRAHTHTHTHTHVKINKYALRVLSKARKTVGTQEHRDHSRGAGMTIKSETEPTGYNGRLL
jgi:hypothetical protein